MNKQAGSGNVDTGLRLMQYLPLGHMLYIPWELETPWHQTGKLLLFDAFRLQAGKLHLVTEHGISSQQLAYRHPRSMYEEGKHAEYFTLDLGSIIRYAHFNWSYVRAAGPPGRLQMTSTQTKMPLKFPHALVDLARASCGYSSRNASMISLATSGQRVHKPAPRTWQPSHVQFTNPPEVLRPTPQHSYRRVHTSRPRFRPFDFFRSAVSYITRPLQRGRQAVSSGYRSSR